MRKQLSQRLLLLVVAGLLCASCTVPCNGNGDAASESVGATEEAGREWNSNVQQQLPSLSQSVTPSPSPSPSVTMSAAHPAGAGVQRAVSGVNGARPLPGTLQPIRMDPRAPFKPQPSAQALSHTFPTSRLTASSPRPRISSPTSLHLQPQPQPQPQPQRQSQFPMPSQPPSSVPTAPSPQPKVKGVQQQQQPPNSNIQPGSTNEQVQSNSKDEEMQLQQQEAAAHQLQDAIQASFTPQQDDACESAAAHLRSTPEYQRAVGSWASSASLVCSLSRALTDWANDPVQRQSTNGVYDVARLGAPLVLELRVVTPKGESMTTQPFSLSPHHHQQLQAMGQQLFRQAIPLNQIPSWQLGMEVSVGTHQPLSGHDMLPGFDMNAVSQALSQQPPSPPPKIRAGNMLSIDGQLLAGTLGAIYCTKADSFAAGQSLNRGDCYALTNHHVGCGAGRFGLKKTKSVTDCHGDPVYVRAFKFASKTQIGIVAHSEDGDYEDAAMIRLDSSMMGSEISCGYKAGYGGGIKRPLSSMPLAPTHVKKGTIVFKRGATSGWTAGVISSLQGYGPTPITWTNAVQYRVRPALLVLNPTNNLPFVTSAFASVFDSGSLVVRLNPTRPTVPGDYVPIGLLYGSGEVRASFPTSLRKLKLLTLSPSYVEISVWKIDPILARFSTALNHGSPLELCTK